MSYSSSNTVATVEDYAMSDDGDTIIDVEDVEIIIEDMQPIRLEDVQKKSIQKSRTMKFILCIMGVTAAMAIAVGAFVGYTLWGGDDQSDEEGADSPPSPASHFKTQIKLCSPRTRFSDDGDEYPMTPQDQALDWLLNEDSISYPKRIAMVEHEIEPWLLQRFALATLYFANNGDKWDNGTTWMGTDTHECEWGFIEGDDDVKCNDDGILVGLNLRQHGLIGSIPLEVGLLSSLTSLNLGHNFLTNTIPPELGSMSALQGLLLQENQLSGTIPTSLMALTDLAYLSLHHNCLTGDLPAQLGNLSSLMYLWLTENDLSGSIPTSLCEANMVIEIDDSERLQCDCCNY